MTEAPTVPAEPAPEVAGFDGVWAPTTASEFGYRVDEVLLGGVNVTAVGRSNEIEGSLTIDGAPPHRVDATVEVENIVSDDSRRDGQFRGRIMDVVELPDSELPHHRTDRLRHDPGRWRAGLGQLRTAS